MNENLKNSYDPSWQLAVNGYGAVNYLAFAYVTERTQSPLFVPNMKVTVHSLMLSLFLQKFFKMLCLVMPESDNLILQSTARWFWQQDLTMYCTSESLMALAVVERFHASYHGTDYKTNQTPNVYKGAALFLYLTSAFLADQTITESFSPVVLLTYSALMNGFSLVVLPIAMGGLCLVHVHTMRDENRLGSHEHANATKWNTFWVGLSLLAIVLLTTASATLAILGQLVTPETPTEQEVFRAYGLETDISRTIFPWFLQLSHSSLRAQTWECAKSLWLFVTCRLSLRPATNAAPIQPRRLSNESALCRRSNVALNAAWQDDLSTQSI